MPRINNLTAYPLKDNLLNADRIVLYNNNLTRSPNGVFAISYQEFKNQIQSLLSFTPSAGNIFPVIRQILEEGNGVSLDLDESNNRITISSVGFTPSQANLFQAVSDIINQGSNISLSKDSRTNRITINSTDTTGVTIAKGSNLPSSPANPSFFDLTSSRTIGDDNYSTGLYFYDGAWHGITGRITRRTAPAQTYNITYGLANSPTDPILNLQNMSFRDGETKTISEGADVEEGQYFIISVPNGVRITRIEEELFPVNIVSSFTKAGNRYYLGALNSGASQNYKITIEVI